MKSVCVGVWWYSRPTPGVVRCTPWSVKDVCCCEGCACFSFARRVAAPLPFCLTRPLLCAEVCSEARARAVLAESVGIVVALRGASLLYCMETERKKGQRGRKGRKC